MCPLNLQQKLENNRRMTAMMQLAPAEGPLVVIRKLIKLHVLAMWLQKLSTQTQSPLHAIKANKYLAFEYHFEGPKCQSSHISYLVDYWYGKYNSACVGVCSCKSLIVLFCS